MQRAIGLFWGLLLVSCVSPSCVAADVGANRYSDDFKENFKTYSFEKQWQIYLKDVKRSHPARSDWVLVMASEGSPMAHFVVDKMSTKGKKPNDAYTFGYTIIQFMPNDVVCLDRVLLEKLRTILTVHGDEQRWEYISHNCSARVRTH